jgi:hypothetical protein
MPIAIFLGPAPVRLTDPPPNLGTMDAGAGGGGNAQTHPLAGHRNHVDRHSTIGQDHLLAHLAREN